MAAFRMEIVFGDCKKSEKREVDDSSVSIICFVFICFSFVFCSYFNQVEHALKSGQNVAVKETPDGLNGREVVGITSRSLLLHLFHL